MTPPLREGYYSGRKERVVLPVELRRTLDIAERDALEIYVDGTSVILRKYEPTCVFCSSSRGVLAYREKNICRDCIRMLQQLG